jgi:hypothetical protein
MGDEAFSPKSVAIRGQTAVGAVCSGWDAESFEAAMADIGSSSSPI